HLLSSNTTIPSIPWRSHSSSSHLLLSTTPLLLLFSIPLHLTSHSLSFPNPTISTSRPPPTPKTTPPSLPFSPASKKIPSSTPTSSQPDPSHLLTTIISLPDGLSSTAPKTGRAFSTLSTLFSAPSSSATVSSPKPATTPSTSTPFSRYCGSSKYPRRKFFSSLAMDSSGYEVSRFLYATSNINLPNFFSRSRWDRIWSERANWIGYIAVSSDATTALLGRRDIVIAWRGTVTKLEWIADLMDFLRPISSVGIPCPDPSVKVESGFVDLYTDKDPSCRFCKYSAREQVLAEVKKLIDHYAVKNGEEVSISVTGHSLGSALAMLSAYDLVETGVSGGKTVCVFSFSGPRVGNRAFKERFEGLGVKALRVVNVHDTVPKVPGILFNERVPALVQRLAEGLPWSYCHVGVELALDHKNSPFLKDTGDPSCFHNLEAHLHLLDGYHGKGQRFVLASGRDPALINKACDFLKDHHMVPPYWRQDLNKGMIRSGDGRWVQPERQKMDEHPPDMYHRLMQLGLNLDH
ncbi:Phospholipase A(1) protein, partial [Dioscorea alata]